MQAHTIKTPADIGALIKQTRKTLKITQEELSLQTGISRPTIRSIENGKETAHVGIVFQLCRDLGIFIEATSPADLI